MPMALAAWVMEPCVPTRDSSAMRPWPPRFSPPTVIQTEPPSSMRLSLPAMQMVLVGQERGASVVHGFDAHPHVGGRCVVQAAGDQIQQRRVLGNPGVDGGA